MKPRCLAVSIVIGILLFACGGSPEERKHRFLELGNKYYETGKYKEASILYRRALQADRRFADAHYALGLTELKLQNLQNAGGAFLRAFQLEPTNLKAFRQLAELHLLALQGSVLVQREETRASLFDITEKAANINGNVFEVLYIQGRIRLLDGDAEAALPLLWKAVKLAPAEIVARLFLATALVHNNQLDEADEMLRETIGNHPDALDAYTLRYALLLRRNQVDKAEEILKQRWEANPDSDLAWAALAQHYLALNREDEMQAVLTKVRRQFDDDPEKLRTLGNFFLLNRRPEDAIPYFEAGMEGAPDRKHLFRNNLVQAYVTMNKADKAREQVEAILEENSSDGEALAWRGIIALRYGSQADRRGAVADLQSAVAELPDNVEIRHYYGESLRAIGDTVGAETQYREAMLRRPDYVLPRYSLIEMHLSRNEFAQADVLAKEILEKNPLDPTAKLARALALIGVREYDDARMELSQLKQRNLRMNEVAYHLARLDLITGRYVQAEEGFRDLLSRYPDSSQALRGLVEVHLRKGNREKALSTVEEAVTNSPDNIGFRMSLVSLAMTLGDLDRAERELGVILKREPDNGEANNRMGEVQIARGRNESAEPYFRKAMSADPPVSSAHFHVGTMLAKKGDFVRARSYFERSLEIQSRSSAALNNLAFSLARMDTDLDQAFTYAQRAVGMVPDHPDYQDTLAYVYIKRNLNTNAIEILNKLVEKYPNRADYQLHLAEALQQNQQTGEARKRLLLARDANPTPEETDEIDALLSKLAE